jgi:hypothetical protein
LYACLGRLSGSADCTLPGIRRERIDGGLLASFSRAGLSDLEEVRRAFEERREHDLATVRALRDSAHRRSIETAENLARVRDDYKQGRIDADEWRDFRTELDAEHAEAAAEAERFNKREAELLAEHAEHDLDLAALQHLADLRSALTAPVRDASTLHAVRLRLAEVFDHFVLCRRSPDVAIGPQPTDLGDGLYLRPVLREDAFDHLTATNGQPTVSRR